MKDNKMREKKYIIIGGRGYIGSKLFTSISQVGPTIRTATESLEGYVQLRLEHPKDLLNLDIGEGDVVYFTAAISSPDTCTRNYELAWKINVTETLAFITNVIDRGARIVFFSSDTVYGEREEYVDESATCNPIGAYAEMKRQIEKRFSSNHSFKSIRLSYVFSREDKFCKYLLQCAARNQPAEIFHPFFRSVIYLDDVIVGLLALAEKWEKVPERIINFGGPHVVSRVDFANYIKDAYIPDLQINVAKPNEDFFRSRPRVIAMNTSVLSRLLGRQPTSISRAVSLEPIQFQRTVRQHD